MKRITVLTFLCLLTAGLNTAFAQQRQRVEPISRTTTTTTRSTDAFIPQGSVMLGGSAGFVTQSADGNSYYVFSFAPNVGYFVVDNFAIGTSVSIVKIKDVDPSFGFGPFLRYYLNMGVFAQAKYEFLSSPSFGNNNITGSSAGVGLGYAAFLNRSVSIEPLVFYNRHFGDLGDYNEFGIQIGVNAYIGR